MKEIEKHLHTDALTINGKTLGENITKSECWDRNLIGTFENPIKPESGIAVLKGNLCPNGAVLKPSAATPSLLTHTGRAVVFEDIDDYKARVDDPNLDIDETCVMVLKKVGPKGYPGMPEVGQHGASKKTLGKGGQRYGSDLRWAHERHRLWYCSASRLTRIRHWWAACTGPKWRFDCFGCAQAKPQPVDIG